MLFIALNGFNHLKPTTMKSIYLGASLLLNKFTANAQKTDVDEKQFTVSGSLDVYLRQNLTGPNGEDAIAPATSLANLNGFALGMANVIGTFESHNGKVGAVADLVFGPRGEDAISLSNTLRPFGSSDIVNQLYVYWNVTENVKLTFGNFNTFLRYEVVSPLGNFNNSTSFIFSYGPFSHTGIKADVALSEDFSLMAGDFNNTDATEYNPDNDYTVGAQLGYKSTLFNFLYGKQLGNTEATFQVDLTTGFDLGEMFCLELNSSYQTTDSAAFYGVALYPQIQTTESLTLGLRAEYFAETETEVGAIGGYDANGGAKLFAMTLTGSNDNENLTIKPKFRIDTTSEETVLDNNLDPSKSLTSFVLAAFINFNQSKINMKKIEAIIRKSKFSAVKKALHEVDVNFFSYWDVTGLGNEKKGSVYRGVSYNTGDIQRRYLSIVVSDEYEEQTIQAIINSSRTGDVGDGKIFVSHLEESYRIRTGEKGVETLK
jgi:nitrogen regulatory protein PII